MASEAVHTYCPMCVAQCGVVAVVEDGRLTKIKPEPNTPTAGFASKGQPRRSWFTRRTDCGSR